MPLRLPMLLTLAASVWLSLGGAASKAAGSEPGIGGTAALAELNVQRATNTIPAGISFSSDAAEGCRLHAHWMDLNHVLQHDEAPGTPGYTQAGDAAGNSSVLGGVWTNPSAGVWDSNPYESAPIHLMQLLGPELSRTGIWGPCASTWPGYLRPPPPLPALDTYPGDGTSGIYGSMLANESPFVPGDFVGLPDGTTTGPHLYVLAEGLGRGSIAEAKLVGAKGPVAVRTVDNSTGGIGAYLPPGGILIPTKPLAPGRYTASVAFAGRTATGLGGDYDYVGDAPQTLRKTWTFTVSDHALDGSSPPASDAVQVRAVVHLGSVRARGRRLVIPISVPTATNSSRVTVRVAWRSRCGCRPKRQTTLRKRLVHQSATLRARIPLGRWSARVKVLRVSSAGRVGHLPSVKLNVSRHSRRRGH